MSDDYLDDDIAAESLGVNVEVLLRAVHTGKMRAHPDDAVLDGGRLRLDMDCVDRLERYLAARRDDWVAGAGMDIDYMLRDFPTVDQRRDERE